MDLGVTTDGGCAAMMPSRGLALESVAFPSFVVAAEQQQSMPGPTRLGCQTVARLPWPEAEPGPVLRIGTPSALSRGPPK